MNEGNGPKKQVCFGYLTLLLTVLGMLIGVWKFTTEQSNQTKLEHSLLARESRIEFERKLWQQKVDTYAKIADLAGRIATQVENADALPKLEQEFLGLYWGTMVLVEDENVATRMKEFVQEIRDFQSGWSNVERVKKRAYQLVYACRESSEKTWKAIKSLREPVN